MTAPTSRIGDHPASDRVGGRGWKQIVVVTLVALAVRGLALVFVPGLTYDGTYYLRQAERLALLEFDFAGFPPGYPILVALTRPLFADAVLAGRVVNGLVGIATIVLFYFWASRKLLPTWAFAGSLFLALHPDLARTHVEILSEPLYIFLLLGGVVLFETRRDARAGLLLGGAFLVRPEALVVLVGLGAWRGLQDHKLPWRLLGVGLLPVVVYAVLASRAVGHVVVTPKQGQIDLEGLWTQSTTTLQMLNRTFPIVLVPAAVWIGIRHHRMLLIPLVYLLMLPVLGIHIQERLLLPALPFLLLLSLLWLSVLKKKSRRAFLGLSVLFFGFFAAPAYARLVRSSSLTPQARAIGSVLRPHLDFEDRVAGRFPFVAYHAGAGFVRIPRTETYFEIMNSITAMGATHLLVLESEMQDVLPQLRRLFDDAGFVTAEGRLEGTAWVESRSGHRAILYRVQPPAIPAPTTRVLDGPTQSCTWSRETLVAATPDGRLLDPVADTGSLLTGAHRVFDPRSGPQNRIVFCEESNGERWIAVLDLESGQVHDLPSTRNDRPAGPVYVGNSGETILYIRQAEPPGLRVVDPQTARIRAVRITGLGDRVGAPLFVAARRNDLAITFQPTQPERPQHRVVAGAVWPPDDTNDVLSLRALWATLLPLHDDAICWVGDNTRFLASVSIDPIDGPTETSLSIAQPDGLYRRLTFDLVHPRRPALQGQMLAFVTGQDELRLAMLPPSALRIQPSRVFPKKEEH